MVQRTIIVGDIHGCFKEFLDLLEATNYNDETDRLILGGDLINKGPYSREMLEWLEQHPKVEKILGNHELKFLESARDPKSASKKMQFLLEELRDDLEKWSDYISNWPLYIEADDFLVVHGGVIPDRHPRETLPVIVTNLRYWGGKADDLNNANNPPWYELYKKEKLIVYGHWAMKGLNVRPNTIGLDTGGVYGRKLSAVILPERKIVSVDANQDYT